MAHKHKPKRRSSPRRRPAQRRRPAARRRRAVRLRVGRGRRGEVGGALHRFHFKADVVRILGKGRGGAFEACVTAGGIMTGRTEVECASARNPRVAVGKALRLMAGKLQGRKGAFAGA